MSDTPDAPATPITPTPSPASPPQVEVTPPAHAEVDGWSVTSASVGTDARQTVDSITEIMADTPPAETPAAEATAETPPDAEKAGRPKKHTPWTQRIQEMRTQVDSLAAAKGRERAERDALAAEVAELKKQRETLTQPAEAAPAPPPADKPTWAAFEAEGKSWDEYAEARDVWQEARLTTYRDEVRAAAVKEAQEQVARTAQTAQRDEAERAHKERLKAVVAEDPDFTARVQNLKDVPTPPFLEDLIKHHPGGARLLSHLSHDPERALAVSMFSREATNAMMDAAMEMADPIPLIDHWVDHPDDFDRVRQMPPRAALLALGALVTRLDRSDSANTPPAGPPSGPPVSRPSPQPLRPVGATRNTAGSRSVDDIPFGPEYVNRANQEALTRKRARF